LLPYSKDCTRLVVLLLDESPKVAAAAGRIAREVLAAGPFNC
jgi:hypothetical protein